MASTGASPRPAGPGPRAGDPGEVRRRLQEEPHWFACRTRGRAEKVARDGLEATTDFEVYLPLVEETHQWSDREKEVRVPLLPGYVFARFRLAASARALRAPRVVEIVQLNGHPAPLSEEEVRSVRLMAEGASRVGRRPEPAEYLQPGEPVEVVAGPFEGMTGTLIEKRSRARVAVKVDALRQARAVELDRESVQRREG